MSLGAVLLCVASLQAPFAHFHPEDPDHHHASGFAHLHLGHLEDDHDAEEPQWADHDEDETAVYQDWIPSAAPRVTILYSEAVTTFAWQPSSVQAGVAPEFTVRSHDPPGQRSTSDRAPPFESRLHASI